MRPQAAVCETWKLGKTKSLNLYSEKKFSTALEQASESLLSKMAQFLIQQSTSRLSMTAH
jgi:hypothetical protein